MRQVVLDTETTGLEYSEGHRIIEIGCVEIIDRRLTRNVFHQYIQPDRVVDQGAIEVHGITNEFLADKPRFAAVVSDFIEYVKGAELIIHNASFDVGFINHELSLLGDGWGRIEDYCKVTDSLALARNLHPGQRNSLDALCKRYGVDNSNRDFHGALLDSELLADVYLTMTGGQKSLSLEAESGVGSAGHSGTGSAQAIRRLNTDRAALRIIVANADEMSGHEKMLQKLRKDSGDNCVYDKIQ